VATVMEKKSATNKAGQGVGVRDLRDHLSRHLETVKNGGEITVTDHGKPVARVVPYKEPTRIEQMIADGRITLPKRPRDPNRPLPKRVEVPGTPLSQLVIEMRR
jgi:prevent-host-death family protein